MGRVRPDYHDKVGPPPAGRRLAGVDAAVAYLAAQQYGVVGQSQLIERGLTRSAIHDRVVAGRLHPLHRGVYAVGHTVLVREGHWLAAVFACGPGAALSHRDGGALWEVRETTRTLLDVTAPRSRGPRKGIDVHRVRRLDPLDVTERKGIPVTTLARTLVDLSSVLSEPDLKRAVKQADILQLLDLTEMTEAMQRANGRAGLKTLAGLLGLDEEPFTRSKMERRFLALCRDAGLPLPRVNAWVPTPNSGYEVDFTWPAYRLAVETDGGETHAVRIAFEEDRVRDAELTLAGWTVVRFTWRRITREPQAVAAILRGLLEQRGWS